MQEKGITSGSRKEFKETDEVNKIMYGCFVEFSGYSNDNDNVIPPRDGKVGVII